MAPRPLAASASKAAALLPLGVVPHNVISAGVSISDLPVGVCRRQIVGLALISTLESPVGKQAPPYGAGSWNYCSGAVSA
jgi:hypothetical protein